MRTHLVTGAGSGIGQVVADALHARGDTLWLVARSEPRAARLRERWSRATVLVADLADPAALEGLTGLPERLDSLVHAAGVVDLAPVERTTLDSWQEQVAVNLTAPMVLTRALLPALRAAQGTVVLVNSTAGLTANAHWSADAASKAGLGAFADAVRTEEAAHGVRVTSVFPSRTATPMQQRVHEQEGRDYDPADWLQPRSVAATVLHVLDLPVDATLPEVTIRPTGRRST